MAEPERSWRFQRVLLLLAVIVCVCGGCVSAAAEAAADAASSSTTVRVSTDAELKQALQQPKVDHIVLLDNIQFSSQTWTRRNSSVPPLLLSRNLTISSEPKRRRLDFKFTATNWLKLAAGARLNISDTALEHSRYGVGIQLDFLAPSPGAILILHNSAVLRHLCVDIIDEPSAIAAVPRIPGFPGPQLAHYAYDVCNEFGCFDKVVIYDDFNKVSTFAADTAAGGYSIVLFNTSKLCHGYANQCSDSNTADACMQRAIDALPLAAPTPGRLAALAAARAQQRQQTALAAGIGAAAGAVGLLLLGLAFVLTVRWCRRRRVQHDGSGGKGGGLLPSRPAGSVGSAAAGGAGSAHSGMYEGQPDVEQPAAAINGRSLGPQHSKDVDASVFGTFTTSSSHSSRTLSQRNNIPEQQPEQPNILQDSWELMAWKTSTHSLRRLSGYQQHQQQHQQQQQQQQQQQRLHGVNDLAITIDSGTPPSTAVAASSSSSSPFALHQSSSKGGLLSSHELMLQGTGASTSQAVMANNKVSLGLCIGAGSFGKVYRGRWRGMEVAVKVMQHSQAAAASVANEVDLMMSFSHPNLVSALHFVTWRRRKDRSRDSPSSNQQQGVSSTSAYARQLSRSSGSLSCSGNFLAAAAASTPGGLMGGEDMQTWIVQEFCDAGNLGDYCLIHGDKQEGQLPTGHAMLRLLFRLREVADGMNYLHQTARVVHGDLKSSNILLCVAPTAPYGRVAKVADFGLARMYAAEETHRSTKTLGTVNHMAPELLRYGKASAAADVYSFGIMMYELFTGKIAFQGWQWGAILEHVALHGKRPDMPEAAPEDFCVLVEACWHQDPSRRPSFEEVLKCLNIMINSRQQELSETAAGISSSQRHIAAVSTSGAALLPTAAGCGDGSHSATLRALSGPVSLGGGDAAGISGGAVGGGATTVLSGASHTSSNGEWDIIRVGSMRHLSAASSNASSAMASTSAAAVIITRDPAGASGGAATGGSRLLSGKAAGLPTSRLALHPHGSLRTASTASTDLETQPQSQQWPPQQQQQLQQVSAPSLSQPSFAAVQRHQPRFLVAAGGVEGAQDL